MDLTPNHKQAQNDEGIIKIMGNAVKIGNIGTDHDGFPPTPVTAGSPTVKFDGIPVARVGDPLALHSKPKHPPHPRSISSGSSTVMIDGKPAVMT